MFWTSGPPYQHQLKSRPLLRTRSSNYRSCCVCRGASEHNIFCKTAWNNAADWINAELYLEPRSVVNYTLIPQTGGHVGTFPLQRRRVSCWHLKGTHVFPIIVNSSVFINTGLAIKWDTEIMSCTRSWVEWRKYFIYIKFIHVSVLADDTIIYPYDGLISSLRAFIDQTSTLKLWRNLSSQHAKSRLFPSFRP